MLIGLALGLLLAGLWTLGKALNWWISLGLLAVAVVAALPDRWKAKVLELLGSVVVTTVTLVGFNAFSDALINKLGLYEEDSSRGWILVGLMVGFCVFAGASYLYLRRRGHWQPRASAIAAAVAAALLILGAPIGYATWIEKDKKTRVVPGLEPVASQRRPHGSTSSSSPTRRIRPRCPAFRACQPCATSTRASQSALPEGTECAGRSWTAGASGPRSAPWATRTPHPHAAGPS